MRNVVLAGASIVLALALINCGPPSVTVSATTPAAPRVTVSAPTPPVVRVGVAPAPPPVVATPTTEEWIHFPVRIIYPSGGSRLDDQARAMLREAHASMAHRTDIVRIRVEGHADGRGTEEANRRLGQERADGVVDFLVGELGLPRELFETTSFGDERPLTSETTAADRVQNRRVEFSLLVRRQAAH